MMVWFFHGDGRSTFQATNRQRTTCHGGQVYDITNWHILHPGGSSLLLKYGGRDATQASSLT